MTAVALACTTTVLTVTQVRGVTAFEPRVYNGEQACAILLFV
jgi:hypothetical protein